jgi:HK97 family phage portal protein
MSWLDLFRGPRGERKTFLPPERKSFPLYAMMPASYGWSAKWSQYTNAQALDARRKSVWLAACIRLRADNIAAVPWVVEVLKGGEWEQAQDHPLIDLLAHPNPDIDLPTMMKQAMYWLDLTGDAWGTKVRDGSGRVYEWWPSLPDIMEVVPGRVDVGPLVEAWKYRKGEITKTMPARDVMHFKYSSPDSVYYGMAPLQAAARSVDMDLEASNFQKITLQNHGIPPGLFTGDKDMTQDQYEQSQKWITEQMGPERSRRPWVASLTYEAMGNSPHELDFLLSRKETVKEICAAFAVPLPMVGVYDDATLANIQTARRIFWMEGLIPVLREIEGQLNLQLASEWGPDVRITYDLANIEALEDDQGAKITRARELWGMGVPLAQINTVLELGLDTDTIEGADVGYLPSGLLPSNFDAGEPDPMSEAAGKVTYGDGEQPPVADPAGPPPSEPVANAAMNGTQVTALQGIAQAVADQAMPAATAIQLILVSFPTITQGQAQAIIGPMEGFEPKKPEPKPNPFEQPPVKPAPAVPPKGKPEPGKPEEEEAPDA